MSYRGTKDNVGEGLFVDPGAGADHVDRIIRFTCGVPGGSPVEVVKFTSNVKFRVGAL